MIDKATCLIFMAMLLGLEMHAQQPRCQGEVYALARQFEGTWQEYTVHGNREKLEGTLTTLFELDGCVITQKFVSPDSSFSFMSFGYVEPASGQWYETYVLSNGRIASYRWVIDGHDILIDLVSGGTQGKRRLRTTFLSRDVYKVVEETSADGVA